MPTYEYECKSCKHSFEVFQSILDDPLTRCPECGNELRRLINGGSGIIFKGSGFYVTDHKEGRAEAAGSSKPVEKSTENNLGHTHSGSSGDAPVPNPPENKAAG